MCVIFRSFSKALFINAPPLSVSNRIIIINIRMYKRRHQLELLVKAEGVAEEGGAGDRCGGSSSRSFLKNNIIGWGGSSGF